MVGVRGEHEGSMLFSTGKYRVARWEKSHITVLMDAAGIKGQAEGQRDQETQADLCYYKQEQI